MERGKKNKRFAAENRPSDVAGDSLLERFKVVKQSNKEAGKRIDQVAQGLKGQPIDLADATSDFAGVLDDFGIDLVSDGKGGLKPSFENSSVAPGDRAPLREVIRQMNLQGRGGVDALTAHKMKRIIDDNVTFGKVKTGLSGSVERALKDFRASIDNALDTTYPAYNQANTQYAETISVLNDFQDIAGKKTDLFGKNADKDIGTLLRRVLSNARSRVPIMDSLRNIEEVAEKFPPGPLRIGEKTPLFKDDLLGQILFVDELDRQFGTPASTSFQGQVQQGVEQAAKGKAGAVEFAVGKAAEAAEKARGINDQNAFKAIRELLKESK